MCLMAAGLAKVSHLCFHYKYPRSLAWDLIKGQSTHTFFIGWRSIQFCSICSHRLISLAMM